MHCNPVYGHSLHQSYPGLTYITPSQKVEAEAADVTRRATEEIVDHAPSLTTPTPIDEGISAEELRNISAAVSSLKGERALAEEKAELEELKEEREEYVEVPTPLDIIIHSPHNGLGK